MSIRREAIRIESDRDRIRKKLIDFGVIQNDVNLDELTKAIEEITLYKDVHTLVDGNGVYTIPKGYHDGSETITFKGGADDWGSGNLEILEYSWSTVDYIGAFTTGLTGIGMDKDMEALEGYYAKI